MAEAETHGDYDAPLTHCRLCSGQLRPFDRDFRQHRVDRCSQCGILVMNPQYSEAHLRRFYSTYISVHHDGADQTAALHALDKNHPDARREGKRRALELLAAMGAKGRVLMVGCGDGIELEVARDLGWSPEGYDVDPATTAAVAARVGVPVHSGVFPELALEPGFDAVFMDQVLEHLKQPVDYLRKAFELLAPGGLLYVAVPNIGSISNRLKSAVGRAGLRRRKRGKHYNTKHHIYYFHPAGLRRLLEREGFEVLTVRGSLKPQRNRLTPLLSQWWPSLDSGFLAVARKREAGGGG